MPPKAKKGPIGNVLATQQEIDRICENAKAQILKQVAEHSRKHPESPFTGYALVELEHSLTELYDSMGVSVGKSFKKGLPKVMQDFHDRAAKDMKSDATRNSIMGKVDNAYINRQLQNSFEQIALRTDKMRTDHIHQLRRFSAEIFRTATLTGASPRDVAKQLMDKALEIPGFQFVGKNGVKWSNQVYFKMLARTELMNAGRDTYAQKCAEEGYDLVMLTTSGKCCEGCAKWEGKIFSLTGAVKGFPTKADLEADGVFHPNCTHTFTAVSDFDLAEMGYDVEQPGKAIDNDNKDVEDEYSNDFSKGDFNPHGFMDVSAPMTTAEEQAIRRYTCGEDGMYMLINDYLAKQDSTTDYAIEKIITNINSAIEKNTLKKDIVVYRGIKSSELQAAIKGGLTNIDINHFNSTSLNPKVSENYAGEDNNASILLKIRLPRGSHCLDVSTISAAPNSEEEILLPAGGCFKIVNYIQGNNKIEVEVVYEHKKRPVAEIL